MGKELFDDLVVVPHQAGADEGRSIPRRCKPQPKRETWPNESGIMTKRGLGCKLKLHFSPKNCKGAMQYFGLC